ARAAARRRGGRGGAAPARRRGRPPAAGIGLTAARRALVVTGSAGPLTGPYVATLTPVANIAVGDETPWGPAAELAELLPSTTADLYPQGATAGEILAAAGERTVVAVVRDAHRHPWMTEVLDALVEARPDTVVVEMGLPRAEPRGALHIATHGAARVCGRAAAEVVAGAVTGV
ncbi:glycoside hydrolase family 3 protein, partial [Streptomyces amritsarensis]